jgi:hypothetical protein
VKTPDGQPYTITEGYTARDIWLALLTGLIAGFCLSLGVLAHLGVERFCVGQ